MALIAPDVELIRLVDRVRSCTGSARVELIAGQVVVNKPRLRHQSCVLALVQALDRQVGDEWAIFFDVDVVVDEKTLISPDIVVVTAGLAAEALRADAAWISVDDLSLAVEVLSPSTEATDRGTKRQIFESNDVDYWLVDPSEQVPALVERFDFGGGRFTWPI